MNAFLVVALALVAAASAQDDGSYRADVHEAPFAYRGEGEAESHPRPEHQAVQQQPQQVQFAQQGFQGFPYNVQIPQVQAQQYQPQQQYVQQAQQQYVQQAQPQYVQQAQPQYVQQAQQQGAEDGSYRPDLYEAPYAYRGEQ